LLLEENVGLFNKTDIDRDGTVNIVDLAIVPENRLRSSFVESQLFDLQFDLSQLWRRTSRSRVSMRSS